MDQKSYNDLRKIDVELQDDRARVCVRVCV
jgi:hypothetical protein